MIHKITDNIYIGNRDDVNIIDKLKNYGINCIYNVAVDVDDIIHENILSIKCGIYDEEKEYNPVNTAIKILEMLISYGYKILIHCYMGHNRAPYIIAKYLSILNKTKWELEFKNIKKIRSEIFIKDWMT